MKNLTILLLFFLLPVIVFAQKIGSFKNSTRVTVESADNDSVKAMLNDYEKMQLPPLSVFLASASEHPSALIYKAKNDEAEADLKIVKMQWLDYIRANANYQYGYNNSLTSYYNPDDPLIYDKNQRAEHRYSVGATINIPIGDLVSQNQKRKRQKAKRDQLKYEYEITLEERKLTILQAYNSVLEQLATIKVKAEAAALYNAQMQISEQDFANGKISIIDLSLERGRRSTAMSNYQQARASLRNSITLLEMLTNVTIMKK
ncbi:MAG: TolC family protein [Muribaculaceae bacterium]